MMRRLPIFLLLLPVAILSAADDPPDPSSPASGEAALFGDMPVVEAAALHAQTLAEAPASVTIVTADDIRIYGYRTLADVLASTRGFSVMSNHLTQTVGVRGMAAPGDVNTCFLIMINGHPMTEIIAQSNDQFGQEFGLDLDLVDRMEIIRGPSSALYGSNGILATINIVTKSPVDAPRLLASVESGGDQPGKAEFLTSQSLGRGVNLLVEGSGLVGSGFNLVFPQYGIPGENHGVANHVEAQSGYHTFANLQWGAWSFTAYFNNHLQRAPVLADGTVFNDQGQFNRQERNFAAAAYTHDFADGGELRWQFSYDQCRYADRYDYPEPFGVLDNRDLAEGDWLNSQLTYSRVIPHLGLLTIGISGKVELRNLVENYDASPDTALNFRIEHPDRDLALFAQQEWNISRKWKAYFGGRLDDSHDWGAFFSPRVALVYQPDARTSYKVVYGRPFRNPSVYEAYYQDGITQTADPHLRPESAQGVEVSAEHKIGPSAYARVNAFNYSMDSVIQGVFLTNGLMQYQNTGSRMTHGIEFEMGGHLKPWLETIASFTADQAMYMNSSQQGSLPNNPDRIFKLRGAVPLYRNRLYFSSDFQYLSARITTGGYFTRPVALINSTLSSSRLYHGLDLIAGIRNVLNWSYCDPTTWPLDDSIDQIPANGRSIFLKVTWRPGE